MSSADRARHHSPSSVSIRSCASHPAGHGGQRGVGGPLRVAQRGPQRAPLLVGRDGDGDPPVVTAALVGTGHLVEVLGRRRRTTVPGPFEQGAVGGELNRLLGRNVECGIDHRRLHQAAFTGPLPVLEREQQAVQRVEPGVGVTDAVGLEREQVRMSGEPGETGGVLDDEGEGRQVAPRPVEPEPGHAHHDEIGPHLAQGLEAETQLVQHPRRVVLDHDVARGDDAPHQVEAARFAQVDGQALLVGVERGEDRAPLPVAVLGLGDPTDQPGPVGTGGGLQVDDLGAEERQRVTGQGPGPERRHVQDPESLEGQRSRRALRRTCATGCAGVAASSLPQLPQAGCRLRAPAGSRPRAGRAARGLSRRPWDWRRTSRARRSAPTSWRSPRW